MPKLAGYSGTPLARKLGIKAVHKVAVVGAPEDFAETLGELPFGATLQNGLGGKVLFDVLVVFVRERKELERQLARLRSHMNPAAGLWVAWPKKASGVATDMSDHVVREIALPTGLVDNKVCAIDEVWSGLRLVVRVENR
jgi:hypothetical protein